MKTFGCVRVVWNWALEIRDRAYRERGEVISTFTLLNRMKRELKAEKDWRLRAHVAVVSCVWLPQHLAQDTDTKVDLSGVRYAA